MNNRKRRRVNSIDERRQFVQEIIDRLLYLEQDDRDRFIDTIQCAFNKFKPKVNVLDDGTTRIYTPINQA